jgi:ATP-dependent DNA ligase
MTVTGAKSIGTAIGSAWSLTPTAPPCATRRGHHRMHRKLIAAAAEALSSRGAVIDGEAAVLDDHSRASTSQRFNAGSMARAAARSFF